MSIGTSADPTVMMNLQEQDLVQRKLAMDRMRAGLNGGPNKEEKLREACEGFESIFVQKIWEQMRKNVQQDSYLHSREEQMYQGMYDGEFAKKMTSAGGIGLADMLYEQLSQRLGESSRTTTPQNNPKLPIIPSGSIPSQITGGLNPLRAGEAQGIPLSASGAGIPLNASRAGIPLPKTSVPLYEEIKEESMATDGEVILEAFTPPEGESRPFAPSLEDELDFEALSQQMLLQERDEPAPEPVPALPNTPDGHNAGVTAPEDDTLRAALRENMNAAGSHAVRDNKVTGLAQNYPGADMFGAQSDGI